MNNYKSISHTTSNEAGEHEVTIEYEKTFLQRLFNLPAIKQTFVGQGGTVWYFKGSGKRAETSKEYEICNVIELCRQQRVYDKGIMTK